MARPSSRSTSPSIGTSWLTRRTRLPSGAPPSPSPSDCVAGWSCAGDRIADGWDRLFVPNTHYNLDLSDHGNPTPGTPVTLWGKWHPGTNQTWRFEEGECFYLLRRSVCTCSPPSTVVDCRVSGRPPRSDGLKSGLRWGYVHLKGPRHTDAAVLARLCMISHMDTQSPNKGEFATYHIVVL